MPDLSYEQFSSLILKDTRFEPFQAMFRHEPLRKFVYYEKCRFSGPLSEDRLIYDAEKGCFSGGDRTNTEMPTGVYSPSAIEPFFLKGIWLPIKDGLLYTLLLNAQACPLIKKKIQNKDHLLFLVHPESETYFKGLIEAHEDEIVRISALSLSSYRSLLVALPTEVGDFEPVLVKVSLNRSLQGVNRLLSRRECALSVGNSFILKRKLDAIAAFPLQIMEDLLSYLPEGYEAGMLYRKLPDFLNPKFPNSEGLHPMPLLSLYGVKNRNLLGDLVRADGGNVTEFLTQRILAPFAKVFLELLLHHQTSIEGHGQNLLLLLDAGNRVRGLVYRDMGGVSQLFSATELALLPEALRDPGIYYFENHKLDAAKALEDHFVRRGLFPLTKQLVKNPSFQDEDAGFGAWRAQCASGGFLVNWSLSDLNSDDHLNPLTKDNYYRYGYVEYLFYTCFMKELMDTEQIDESTEQEMSSAFFSPEKLPNGDLVAPCTNIPFFKKAISLLLSKQLNPRNEIYSILNS